MVLCRSTNESHAANVDVFDGIGVCNPGVGDRLLKRIEVDGDQVNVIPVEIQKLLVIFLCRTGEESAVDGGVEGFDSPAKNFGGPGIVRNFDDGGTILAQQFRGPARREKRPTEINETSGKFKEPSFVVN